MTGRPSGDEWGEGRRTPLERRQEIQRLLHLYPAGLRAHELADRLGVTIRTIERDIEFLRDQLNARPDQLTEPLPRIAGRYVLQADEFPLTAVTLADHEARALLFAARLFVHHASTRDEDAVSAFQKLAGAFPGVLAGRFTETIAELSARPPAPEGQSAFLRRMVDAWRHHRTVQVRYRAPESERPERLNVDPYLIEPGKSSSAIYVHGFCHERQDVRTYVIDRMSEVEILRHTFPPPPPAALRAMSMAVADTWGGAIRGGSATRIVLRFVPEAAVRALESHWHPSRVTAFEADGSLRMELTLPKLMDFRPWVLSWGAEVEVLEPPELRADVAAEAAETAARYRSA